MITHFNMEEIIDRYLKEKQLSRKARFDQQLPEETHFNSNYYYISAIGYCLRKHYYLKRIGSELDATGLRNVELGNIVQDYLDKLIMMHYAVQYNENVTKIERSITIPLIDWQNENDIYLTGRIDHLLAFTDSKNFRYFFPIECKYLVNRSVDSIKAPFKNHLYQIQTYMLAMGSDGGAIYYVDHSLRTKTFNIALDRKLIKEGFDRIVTVHSYLEENVVPPAEARFSDDPEFRGSCRFCAFYRQCKEQEEKKR